MIILTVEELDALVAECVPGVAAALDRAITSAVQAEVEGET